MEYPDGVKRTPLRVKYKQITSMHLAMLWGSLTGEWHRNKALILNGIKSPALGFTGWLLALRSF